MYILNKQRGYFSKPGTCAHSCSRILRQLPTVPPNTNPPPSNPHPILPLFSPGILLQIHHPQTLSRRKEPQQRGSVHNVRQPSTHPHTRCFFQRCQKHSHQVNPTQMAPYNALNVVDTALPFHVPRTYISHDNVCRQDSSNVVDTPGETRGKNQTRREKKRSAFQ
jgi:hypothetical protein